MGSASRTFRDAAFYAAAALAYPAAVAFGQAASPAAQPAPRGGQALQRAAQVDELEQIRFDARLRANDAIPPGQRLLLDYGGYAFFSYLSVDDVLHHNHGVRESDFYAYARANLDGAQELFLRARVGYQDFNTGTGFTGHDDQPIEGDLDRAYYRLDLRRYNQAYGTAVLGDFAAARSDSNLVFQGGRDFVYWANGLVLARVLDGVNVEVSKGPFECSSSPESRPSAPSISTPPAPASTTTPAAGSSAPCWVPGSARPTLSPTRCSSATSTATRC